MKRLIALLCAFVMMLCVLAGCGSSAETPKAETPKAESSVKEEAPASAEVKSEAVPIETPTPTTKPLPTESPEVQEFWGYVIDICCFEIPGPEEDTWDCLLMDSCRDSGYGLAIPDSNAPNGYTWFAFDEKGQELAFDAILNSNKWVKISLKVTGILENNIIKVQTLKEG